MALKNAFGDIALDETLRELRDSTQEMTRLVSAATRVLSCMRVDPFGRQAITVEASSNTQAISGSVSGTVSIGNDIGSYPARTLLVAAPQLAADSLRRNITTT